MKSNRYWFSKLTEEEQEAFKSEPNNNNEFVAILEGYSLDMESFLSKYLLWGKSEKGYQYWNNIVRKNLNV